MTTMKFLRLNVNDDYNYGMGGADIVDQICVSYSFYHWLRNYKWWHAIFFLGISSLNGHCLLMLFRVLEEHRWGSYVSLHISEDDFPRMDGQILLLLI